MKRLACLVTLLLIANVAAIGVPLYSVEFYLGARERSLNLPIDGFHDGVRYTWGHKIIRNKFGFREREIATPKPSGTYRIMVLGDSLTFGVGLALEERFSNQLETLLTTRYSPRKLEVLNFGSPGFSTVRELEVLRKHVAAVDPDQILVGFCFNDPQQREQDYSPERERFKKANTWIRFWRDDIGFWGFPNLAKLFESAMWRGAELTDRVPSWEIALARSYQPESQDWKDFLNALSSIRAISDQRGLAAPLFAVLNQGSSSVRGTDYKEPDQSLRLLLSWWRQAQDAASAAGYIAFNHEAQIIQEANGEMMAINSKDGHPSAHLNQIYARRMFEIIAMQGTVASHY